MKKIMPYIVAISIGLLAMAPPLNYDIPMVINSFAWLYMVIAAGLLGFYLLFQRLHWTMKVLMFYLYAASYLSQAPAASFNGYTLLVVTVYFFIMCRECDYEAILKMVEAVFWMQCFIALMQWTGHDRLTCFGSGMKLNEFGELISDKEAPIRRVFFGTIFQEMRLGSLFAIISPLLILKNRWYIVPLLLSAWALSVSGFMLALFAGIFVYVMIDFPVWRRPVCILLALGTVIFAIHDWPSIRVSIVEGRLPVWWVCIKTWVLDTTGPMGKPDLFGISQTGPWQWDKFFFGHGIDTFLPLFPYYKHDPNPFPQAHNDWIQLAWETGIIGFTIFSFYCGWLIKRLYVLRETLLLAGLAVISVNMFFAFPWRMTQTVLMMVVFVAYCEKTIKERTYEI